jgi:hypothetical protein
MCVFESDKCRLFIPMWNTSDTFVTRVIIRKTAQYVREKFVFLFNYQKFRDIYRHEPLFTTTISANIISFCVSWFLPIIFHLTSFVSNLRNTLRSFYLLLISHGVRYGAVSWGAVLQAERSRVRFTMVSLEIFHWHNPSGLIMALGVPHTLTEISTRNNSWGVKAASM